nr:YrbL family protein [Rhodovulum sulfidophilum]
MRCAHVFRPGRAAVGTGRLYDISICAADMGPANFVHGYRGAGRPGSNRVPQWVLVDGFGDRYAITARSYSRRIRLRGMDSRFRKGKKVRGLRWCSDERQFEFEDGDRPAT